MILTSVPARYPFSGLKHVTMSSNTEVFCTESISMLDCIWTLDELRCGTVLDYQSINIFQKAFQALLKGSLHSSPVVQLLVPENLDMPLVRSRLHVGIKSKKRGLVFFTSITSV